MAFLILTLLLLLIIFLIYASANIRSGFYVRSFSKGKTDAKIVALTFDDGPEPTITHKLLDVLSAEQVKAAFFCIGEKVEQNRDVVIRIAKEGHLIGCHSYKHTVDLTFCSHLSLKADLIRCLEVLEKTIGEKIQWYRPPYGITNPVIGSVSRELALKVAGWSVRSFDTMKDEHGEVIKRIISRVKPGSVILLHDRMPFAPELAQQLIKELKEKGYSFERFDKLIKH
jgi:peptidoglycan/xylan/chitin deacetylase (PgdA/CDA1 family)